MILVFDMGATRTRLALSDGRSLQNIYHFDTDRSSGGLERLAGEISRYVEGHKISKVVGGIPGQLDSNQRFQAATNLPNWIDQPLLARLKQAVGVEVRLYNDVELAGIAEATEGAGAGYGVVAYLTVSTGVNGVRLVNGVIDRTIAHYEIGKQLIPSEGGAEVTLEEAIGGLALGKRTGMRPEEIRERSVWQTEARMLACGIFNTSLHWSPEAFVLGGAMMKDIDIADVRSALTQLPETFMPLVKLKLAKLGDERGLVGAMVVALGRH